MLKFKPLVLATSTIVFFSACGGGSSPISTPVTEVTGIVTDGPIKNALVYIDENSNGQFDETEYHSFTDEDGRYTIKGILDNDKEYMVIVEGSNDYGTQDPLDNPGENLTFKMFNLFQTITTNSSDELIGTKYTVNHNANLFKETLKTLDENTFNAITNSYSEIKNFINDTSNDNTELFKKYIKNIGTNSVNTELTTLISEVTQYLDKQNNEQQSNITNNLLGLTSDSFIATSSFTSNSLIDNSTTQKSEIGTNYIFSKELNTNSLYEESNSGSSSYITTYDNILQIPGFEILQNEGYSFVSGADIKTDNTTGSVPDILDNLLENLSFSDKAGVILYQYNGTSWTKIGTTFDIVSNEIPSAIKTAMTLNPFIILEDNSTNQTTKTLDVSEFSSYTNPLVVIKNTKGDIIDYVEVTGDSIDINYDSSETIGSVVVLSEDFKDTTNTESIAVSLNVAEEQNGDLSLEELPITNSLVTGDSLLDIKDGNNIYEIYGAQNMIRTDIAYKVMSDYGSDITSYNNYTASNIGNDTISVVFKKTFENISEMSTDYEESESSSFEGVVIFDHNNSKILSAKYYQDVTLTNSVSGTNILSGYVSMKGGDSSTALTFEKGNYEFSVNDSSVGTYTILTSNGCNPIVTDDDNIKNDSAIIKGKIEVTNASTLEASGNAQVNNTITTAIVTTTNTCQ